ncbi:protein NDUFAF4 homolog [Daphnia magna]|uniref:NADH dehydrogenase [ubiquinone] 1 alpha subcomplex assembly factor 4 n=1 Tax=Daphnia magna TaxID=35525 RepID=A0ABQ9ZZ22_9CRUS|nr:protein NDUFAF4 homolog [Daphnia magna]KAK4018163.1 hypothetical protein OUZ56_000233 [Daphnia magna]
MGNIAIKASRKLMRPLKNFAVEARAERVLAKEKPTPAPWHPTTQKRIDELIKSNPDLIDGQLAKKDELLGNRLKQIYVTSRDKPIIPKNIEKTLPAERNNVESPEFGYQEPARITKGKLSIRQALLLIGKHHQDPVIHNAVSLANEYTIHPRVSENILKYFKTFEYYQPPKVKTHIQAKDYITFKSLPTAQDKDKPLLGENSLKS